MPIPLFLIPIVVGLITQFSKRFFSGNYTTNDLLHDMYLPRYGGMPSSHTSFAFSLATVVALYDGFFSATFAMAVAGVIFILDDALRMRMFLSRHGLAIDALTKHLPESQQKDIPHLETRLGHTPREVLVGACIGILLTLVLLLPLTLM